LAEKVLETPWLVDDARFQENRGRVEHRAELIEMITDQLKQKDEVYWVKKLNGLG